jgi:hypothetical protein
MRLRHRRGGARVRVAGRHGVYRRGHQFPADADLNEHIGARVLHRLERADRAPELLPHLDIGDGRAEHRFRDTEAVARDGDGRPVEQRRDRRMRVAGELPHRRLRYLDVVRVHVS